MYDCSYSYGAEKTDKLVDLEEGVELVEQFFTEIGEWLERGGDVFLKLGKDALLVVARLDAHQVDITRVAFHLCADEDVAQGVEELFFELLGVRHGAILCVM